MTEQERARDKTPDEKIDEARQQRASDDDSTEKPKPSDSKGELGVAGPQIMDCRRARNGHKAFRNND